jgi:hypothetical protein
VKNGSRGKSIFIKISSDIISFVFRAAFSFFPFIFRCFRFLPQFVLRADRLYSYYGRCRVTIYWIFETETGVIDPFSFFLSLFFLLSPSLRDDSFVLQVGTLQEATGCLELFQEDIDELRSSTEELYFMEKQKGQTECEKPSSAAQVRIQF